MNHKNKAFGLLGLLIVLAIVAGGAYLAVKNINNISTTLAPTGVTTSSPIEQTKPVVKQVEQNNQAVNDEMVSWKTYRDNESRFEFKYPGDWKIEAISTREVFIKPPSENQSGVGVVISEQTPSGCPPSTQKFKCEILTNKNNVSYLKVAYTGPLAPGQERHLDIFFESSKLTIQFDTVLGTAEVFDQILSTFKFTK